MPGRGKPNGLTKSGGRKKGGVGKIKGEAEVAASGITPLDYMLGIMRTETPEDSDAQLIMAHRAKRFEAAKAAAPYVHARLQAMTLGSDPDKPLRVEGMSDLEMARRLAFILTSGAPGCLMKS